MAYHNRNYLKRRERILEVYKSIKESDRPDSRIVKNDFPKHGINISYRGWMFIKNYEKKEEQPQNQLSLFA
ncbi:MAG: hypothetical protein ACXVAY_01480 [Mucilaginibacter sp.]